MQPNKDSGWARIYAKKAGESAHGLILTIKKIRNVLPH
jgi:hypothetical protein